MVFTPEPNLGDLLGMSVPTFVGGAVCVLNAIALPAGFALGYAIRADKEPDWHFHIERSGVRDIRHAFPLALDRLVAYGVDRQLYLNIYQPLGRTLNDYVTCLVTELGDEQTYLSIKERSMQYCSMHLPKLAGENRPAWTELSKRLGEFRKRAEEDAFQARRKAFWSRATSTIGPDCA